MSSKSVQYGKPDAGKNHEYCFSRGVLFAVAVAILGVLPAIGGGLIRATATAVGSSDGSSWMNAMAWTDAFLAAAAATDPTEIWLSGDVTISAVPTTVTVATNVLVRGGFAGTEDSPAGRIAGAVSTFTGNDAYNLFVVSVNSGCTLGFERVLFTRAKTHAIQMSGNGGLTFTDCLLSQNGRTIGHNSNAQGCGLYATGKGEISLDNCRIEGNGPINYPENTGGGWGVYVASASRVFIDDCNFVTNTPTRPQHLRGSPRSTLRRFRRSRRSPTSAWGTSST